MRERVFRPILTDVWGAVVQHDICLTTCHVTLQQSTALRCRDVLLVSNDTADGLDRHEVDADDRRARRHVLGSYLEPAAGGGAEIDEHIRFCKEIVLLIQLDELKRTARAVALLLGKVVVLILRSACLVIYFRHLNRERAAEEEENRNAAVDPQGVSICMG